METLFILVVSFFVVVMSFIYFTLYSLDEFIKPSIKQRYARMLKRETARRDKLLKEALKYNRPPLFHSPKKPKSRRK